MEKIEAVATLGQDELLKPARVKAALAANDRLKLYLSVLQAADARADKGDVPPLELSREFAAAGLSAPWLAELPASAYREGRILHLPEFARLTALLREDLRTMARPLEGDAGFDARLSTWTAWLERLAPDALAPEELHALVSGKRGREDSIHLLVMDLHKALNHVAAELSSETIDGAHVWQLEPADRARVAAFMRGLNATRALKLDHPGLDTAATCDGERLLLQNDIGTNDAHVLVIQVQGQRVSLTYSDLHRRRFSFFRTLLEAVGAAWSDPQSRITAGLNAGEAYYVGVATFDCRDEEHLQEVLEGIGSRIVFLIDWNRARKRLEKFVAKPLALAVLTEVAGRRVGHTSWLAAGGEKLIFGAMQALGTDYFHLGDRLDEVIGDERAKAFLVDAFALATDAMQQHQPLALIADDVRLLLARYLRRNDEFDLLAEHAAYCHALAEGIRDALAHGHERERKAARAFAERAKDWERRADQLVMDARARAQTRPRWAGFALLVQTADDVADALEEAAFLLSLLAADHHQGWRGEVQQAMQALAGAVLGGVQDHVKAIAIARGFGEASSAEDHEEFVAALWRVLNAERQCDLLLREVRRALAERVSDAATLSLSTDFAQALEAATDALLSTGYGLRRLAFSRAGVGE
ncbi:phosphate transport regulator [Thauera phenolivorans]|uniref:phosphate transport regulator n=1 Tax=Thauera phenolivorans TaxID=1792543 RepID=UPI00083A9215|nr:phosphate transport regulator [Thauera phenolivorans]